MLLKLYKLLAGLATLAVVAGLLIFWLSYQPANLLAVDFLDVGQGDAILIKTPAGQNILIDGGPSSKIINQLSENLAWWDRKIDLMILTHPHDDHVTGLIEVLKRYQVKQILYTGVVHTGPNYLAWLEQVREQKIKMIIIDRPQTINLAKDCSLEIIYPRTSLLGREVNNLNNASIALKLVYGQTKFLLAGDIEAEVEQELIKSGVDLTAQVFKLNHHGSNSSNSQEFLEKIQPEFAVIEVGADNKFGHPSQRVLKRLERLKVKVLRTDQNGTIKFISNGQTISLK